MNRQQTANEQPMNSRSKIILQKILAVGLLLAVWQAAALLLDQKVLLCTPLAVLERLPKLITEPDFLSSVRFSFRRIAGGFFLALFLGILLAALAGRFQAVCLLLQPLMLTIRSVPVASFIIIALVWLSASELSVFISFLIVLPVIYNNVLAGIRSIDRKMLEMAKIFRLPLSRRLLLIWLPGLRSHLFSACGTALGLAWKSGIAAEVIGIPNGSIGAKLYEAKAWLNTTDLFAWTVVIVAVSLLFEKLCIAMLNLLYRKLEEI